MTSTEWETLLTQLLSRHWLDYMAYDEGGHWGVAECIKNGYRGVRNALRDLPISDDDAVTYREAITRLKTGKGHYVTFYQKEDTTGWGDAVFDDVAEKLQACLNALSDQS